MSIDDEADALLKRWNTQQSKMHEMNPNQQQPGDGLSPDQSPHLSNEGTVPTSPDQTPSDPVNSVRPMDFSIKPSATTTVPSITTSGETPDLCKQCGTMHPPIAAGKTCPLISVTSDTKDSGLDDTIVNKHLVEMRNIIMTQISSKNIKDGKKFFQYAIIELVKVLEAYNE